MATEIYKSIFEKNQKVNKIDKIAESLRELKNIRKQIREDEESGNEPSPEGVISKIESALIDAIKTLGATDEITADLITTVGKLEGSGQSDEVQEEVSSDSIDNGYNDENNQNMNVDMNEEDEIVGSEKDEMTSAEESTEDDSEAKDDKAVEDMWGSDKEVEEGVTDLTQTTEENPPVPAEEELEENEELDREEELRKTGQFQLPSGKVNENYKKYERKFK